MRKLIKQLSDLRGISGFEYRLNNEIKKMLEPYADEVKTDALGNVIAIKRCGKKNAPSVMVEAHCDEIGLMVTSVTKEGFITFANVGGVDPRILPSLEVTVHGRRDIFGVVGIKPAHLLEDGKSVKIRDMAIDTGLSADEVKELVSVGDSITIAQSVGKIGSRQWSGKTLDDRASLAAVIQLMKNLKNVQLFADVYAVAAVQEEVGCRGGKVAAYGINPTMAIAIDVTHGITPDNSDGAFELGSGAVVAVGPNIHPMLSKRLFETAKKHKIKTETEVEGGDTGTDAWEMQVAADGIPTALLSIPLKYMHTSVETLAVSDVEAVTELLENFIKELEEDISWLNL
ncbi:MAG: M42 family peptidase [Clostridia bacterium]|nr:M42 family peptidase [Clostridia bacterium]